MAVDAVGVRIVVDGFVDVPMADAPGVEWYRSAVTASSWCAAHRRGTPGHSRRTHSRSSAVTGRVALAPILTGAPDMNSARKPLVEATTFGRCAPRGLIGR
jgi:hypothetical protein